MFRDLRVAAIALLLLVASSVSVGGASAALSTKPLVSHFVVTPATMNYAGGAAGVLQHRDVVGADRGGLERLAAALRERVVDRQAREIERPAVRRRSRDHRHFAITESIGYVENRGLW